MINGGYRFVSTGRRSIMVCANLRNQEQKRKSLIKLSDMYENGIGVEQDREKAVKLRTKAERKESIRYDIRKTFIFLLLIARELFVAGMRRFHGIFPFNAFMCDAEDIWSGLWDK